MQPILTAAETQALDRETEARGVSIEELMERAGHGVAQAAVALAGGAYGMRVVAVCGKGNNGGDAMVAARALARRGMRATVVLLAEPSGLRDPAATNFLRLETVGVGWRRFSPVTLARELERADVAIDGLFGSGFRGVPEGDHARAIDALNASDAPVVAVDIPSGVEGDSGAVHGPAVRAAITVTFGAPKVGDILPPGAGFAGTVTVVDIGFPEDLLRSDILLVEAEDVLRMLPFRAPDAHKRRSGVVLVVGGSRGMTGAPRLMAQGAYRAGAGLVTVAVPRIVLPVVQAGIAEATFLPLPSGPAGSATEAAWDPIAEVIERFDAVALGPGLSTDEETPAFVRRVVRESPIPVVVDADAINAFAGRAGELTQRASDAVITPHAGEFGRLFGMPSAEVEEDRVGFVRKAAAETRAITVLKGPRTLIGIPEGEIRVNSTGSAALATGGTGDVLSGAIATYLGRGLSPADAATAGVFVHGLAGEIAGEDRGEGATAPDVARAIPEAVRRIKEASA